MNGIFNYDNKAFEILNKAVDWVFVSILWLIFSLPVFTIGASTTALFETVHKAIRKSKGYVWRTFWTTFKSNFKKITKIWLIQFAVMALLFVDMKIMQNFLEQGSKLGALYYFFYLCLFFMYVWVIYTCVYTARIEDNVKVTMKNAAFMAIMNIPWALVIIALFIAAVIIVSVSPICALVLPAGVFVLYDMILMRVFNKYINMADEDNVEDNSDVSIVSKIE